MHAAADGKRQPARGVGHAQRLLERQRRAHGVERIGKHGVNAVARRLDDLAMVALDGAPRELVVAGEGGAHALGHFLPEAGAPFDIGEEKRRDRELFLHAGPGSCAACRLLYRAARLHGWRRIIRTEFIAPVAQADRAPAF